MTLREKTALGLYRMHVDAHDDDLSQMGFSRGEILNLARRFDDDTGAEDDPCREAANVAISAAIAALRN